MKRLYLIGGPMGVGKTAVCRELQKRLDRSVFLDGDWCWDAHPFQVTEETKTMVMENICFLLNNFLRCSAYDHVIFCWVLHQQAVLDSLLSRLDVRDREVRAVSLTASPEALTARIEKDIQAGRRDRGALERSLAYLPLYAALNAETLDISGLAPAEAARRLEEMA
ncbi:AAA family ATPase [uncultured Oscillibacter sp.]|uniref:AAA family ATPase n=1 Tax=uncultured Oscillibacter sp. TaxID=876091 RepID=UPI00261F197E|nr:AAA family ATPase [uncultured Oscillibacter sp.]